jgi:ribosome-binding factor A
MTRRTERIGEQLRAELSQLLREEVTDPRVGMVTLTRVDVSPDLAQALVMWSPLDPKTATDPEAITAMADGLASAAAFLRRRVAKRLTIRRSPALAFRHDLTLQQGAGTLDLIRELNEGIDG